MNREELPYVAQCGFCENGLLRFMRCVECDTVSAVCDECELIWKDLEEVSNDRFCSSSSAFPSCPNCDASASEWTTLEYQDVEDEGLSQFTAGDSV